ncbi:MAG: hypothetical protein JWM05_1351 [Acidimicrobiales bacterium]|nr:hypothetical protein [Acidimicrobiales bacterium]
MADSYSFDAPRLFTVGAVGEVGSRVFFIQAHAEGTTVSVKCEKQQAAALAEHLQRVLADAPAVDPDELPPLIEPLPPMDIDFVVGSISIGYDEERDRVLLVLEELRPDDEDEAEPADVGTLHLRVTRGQVAAFIDQAASLVAAGRPPCRLCGQPIDPNGHVCPRLN